MGTIAKDIIKNQRIGIGLQIDYKETETWFDGTAITDEKCTLTSPIYRKKGTKYYVDTNYLAGGTVAPERFGAVGNNITDDTIAFNRAITFLAITAGGQLVCGAGKKYKITGTLLLPSNIIINLNGSYLIGDGTNVILKTAYLNGNVVEDNTSSIPKTQIVQNAGIKNGHIQNAARGLHLYNFVMGCVVENIRFFNVEQSWYSKRCFYTIYRGCWSSGANTASYCYHFDEQTNAVLIDRVTATKNYCFLFENGTTALTIVSPTTEGGTTGFKFKGDCLGITINGHYAEAIKDVYDFSEISTGFFKISGGYYNITDRVIVPAPASGILFGTFDETNSIVNIGSVLNSYTYRGLIDLTGGRTLIRTTKQASHDNTLDFPSNYITDGVSLLESIDRVKITSTSVAGANLLSRGTIPLRRSGDTGLGYVSWVLGATSSLYSGTSAAFTIKIQTKIKYSPYTLFAKFLIRVTVNSANYDFYGDIFGEHVKRSDTNGKTMTLWADGDTNVYFLLGDFNGSDTSFTATGSIQIVG
ncbi:pectate lyase family protein [Niabella aquatica]